MHHLFIIHSHATHRCALGVIRHLGLPGYECVFGKSRGFHPPQAISPSEAIPCVPLDFLGAPNGNSIRQSLGLRDLGHTIDRFLLDLFDGGKFHVYLPHTYYDAFQLVATHPRCQGFSYIEEGLTSYYSPGEIEAAYPSWRFTGRTKLLRKILFGNRIREQIPFFRDDYEFAYGFTDHAFPNWPRQISIGLDNLFTKSKSATTPSPPVLVFDSLVELKLASIDAMNRCLDQFLNILIACGFRELIFKFHPGQNTEGSISAMLECFKRHRTSIKATPLAENTSLEDYFSAHDADIFVFNSAAGLYAALRGYRVMSLNTLLEDIEPAYRSKSGALPALFHKLVPPVNPKSFMNLRSCQA